MTVTEEHALSLREDRLRTLIKQVRHFEEAHRRRRQELEAELRRLVQARTLKAAQAAAQAERNARCPPGFREACVLKDGLRCPHYHDGKCEKADYDAHIMRESEAYDAEKGTS